MDDTKQFLIEYFKKLLDNDLTVYTFKWIDDNYETLGQNFEDTEYIVSPQNLWCDYLDHFSEKHGLGLWHKVMPYDDKYNIFIDVGFSEKSGSRYARRICSLMKDNDDVLGWSHDPSIFYWLPRLFYRGKESYKLTDYY